ncbi:MAG: hypothetical protein BWY42_01593 [Candidatus Omnitrophica bacterium ADurb.Bin277]|nr:MAG: hypothetical protein BWY42_01593 [Candidatus Omnitrophica bacterium ADurb.Bin277]
MEQCHLEYSERINLGSYYTKPDLVSRVYNLLRKNVRNFKNHALIDTSCGYGSFFSGAGLPFKKIGSDIDPEAIERASDENPGVSFVLQNSLLNVSRKRYGLSPDDRIVIVGNPPYNDTTSIIRKSLKRDMKDMDPDLKTRDLGISFLLSYNKLNADYICVLHPLSYLIKKANFALLSPFTKRYKLIDAVVISSDEFSETSKATPFPIVIALYRRDEGGMDYSFIENYNFRTKEGKTFKLSSFDSIARYLSKYPNQNYVDPRDAVAKFWTMRDINALKRSRTFIQETTANTVLVTSQKLDYYCYVDVFKRYASRVPYYFGNCDVMIDHSAFLKIRDVFRCLSLKRHPQIKAEKPDSIDIRAAHRAAETYFKRLLGEHYVY